ncbi:MAG: flagellar hook-basal body complex protein FliE [Treponema sp.]|jgi:flagellar hook-basal body complex protein FliE|nr:flagellar hook-basal body complex protein FliE [Treponema sp.]
MNIFNNDAYISAAAAKDYATSMKLTNPKHMLPPDSPYFGSASKIITLEKTIGAESVTGAGTFEHAMLQALDKVSGTQQYASALGTEAMLNPDSVDVHDVTIAQSMASMSLDITRNILSRLVQGWRDLINTR